MFYWAIKFPSGLNVHHSLLVLRENLISCVVVLVRHIQTAENLAPISNIQLHVLMMSPVLCFVLAKKG